MSARDNSLLHSVVDARLAEIAAASPTPPPRFEAWSRLGPKSSDGERLAVYRAVRDAGAVPEDAGLYLVSWQIDLMTLYFTQEALREFEDRREALKRRHGLDEDEDWPPGEGPPEYEEVRQQYEAAWDALYAAKLDEFGERDVARLFRTDRERFDQRMEAGREFFHGPIPAAVEDPLEWLDTLREDVAACMEADSPMGSIGLRYLEEDGIWEVMIYPAPVELLGGANDGAVIAPGFSLNLEQLRSVFDSVSDFGWNALGLHMPEGPYVHVEGVYQGHEIYLQVLAQAPEDEEPGLKVDTNRRPRKPE